MERAGFQKSGGGTEGTGNRSDQYPSAAGVYACQKVVDLNFTVTARIDLRYASKLSFQLTSVQTEVSPIKTVHKRDCLNARVMRQLTATVIVVILIDLD